MALPTEPTYSTIEDFQAYTPVAAQNEIEEDDWTPYALRAEIIIDSLVTVPAENFYAENQQRKFPIKDSDGNSLMPDNVTLAHIEITSDLILKGSPSAYDGSEVTSESWSGTGYSVTKQKNSKTTSDNLRLLIPPLALRLLKEWLSTTSGIKI